MDALKIDIDDLHFESSFIYDWLKKLLLTK